MPATAARRQGRATYRRGEMCHCNGLPTVEQRGSHQLSPSPQHRAATTTASSSRIGTIQPHGSRPRSRQNVGRWSRLNAVASSPVVSNASPPSSESATTTFAAGTGGPAGLWASEAIDALRAPTRRGSLTGGLAAPLVRHLARTSMSFACPATRSSRPLRATDPDCSAVRSTRRSRGRSRPATHQAQRAAAGDCSSSRRPKRCARPADSCGEGPHLPSHRPAHHAVRPNAALLGQLTQHRELHARRKRVARLTQEPRPDATGRRRAGRVFVFHPAAWCTAPSPPLLRWPQNGQT